MSKQFNFPLFAESLNNHISKRQVNTIRRISYRVVAKETGLSLFAVHQACNGHEIKLNYMLALCEWMGVNITYYLRPGSGYITE